MRPFLRDAIALIVGEDYEVVVRIVILLVEYTAAGQQHRKVKVAEGTARGVVLRRAFFVGSDRDMASGYHVVDYGSLAVAIGHASDGRECSGLSVAACRRIVITKPAKAEYVVGTFIIEVRVVAGPVVHRECSPPHPFHHLCIQPGCAQAGTKSQK